ncbi:MAG TPA: translation initiation factor IF-2 N-terminal domain-containing protein, partial [Polyangiaceae bacterium]
MSIKLRVYEVAKDLGVENKVLVALLQAAGVPDVKNHMSAVSPEGVERVKRHLEKQKQPSVVEERIRPTVVKRRAVVREPASTPSHAAPVASAPAPTTHREHREEPQRAPQRHYEEPARPAFVAPPEPAPVVHVREREVEPPPPPPAPVPAVEAPPRAEVAPETSASVSAPVAQPAPVVAAPSAPAVHEVEAPSSTPAPIAAPPPAPAPVVSAAAPVADAPRAPTPAPRVPPAPPPVQVATPAAAHLAASSPAVRTSTAPKTGIDVWEGRPGVPMPAQVPRGPMPRRVQYDAKAPGAIQGRPPAGGGGARPQMGGNRGPQGRGGMRPRGIGSMPKGKISGSVVTQERSAHKKIVRIEESIGLQGLAAKIGAKATEVLMKLMRLGMTGVNINSTLDAETAKIVANEFGWEVSDVAVSEEDALVAAQGIETEEGETRKSRPPVVTVMGHVD